MRHKIFCTLLMWMLWVSPFSALCARNVAASKESIKEKLSSEFFENLYSKTYYSLLDRMDEDGYLPESLTGAYQGMFPRTTGALTLLLIETERYDEAEANIRYVLNTVVENDMERIPRVIGKASAILDDQHQIDGQAHVILAWARLALRRGPTQFEDETWELVRDLMKRTCDRTFFLYGGWSIEPELVRNIALEHSKEHRMWDVFDLLTQCFVGAAMTDMAVVAERHDASDLAADWRRRIGLLKEGVNNNLTTEHYGKRTYAEMRVPNGDAGTIYPGLGWVTLAPVAAGWEPLEHQILKNTVAVMNEKLLKRTNGVAWMPTDGYPDARFSNEIIGKGIGWELDFARAEGDYTRIEEILHLLETVNAGRPIYMEGAWLEGNGIGLSDIISDSDLERMATSVWQVKDAGNGEQTAWWCWAMARLRRSVGLPAEPGTVESPKNLISIAPRSGWGKRTVSLHSSSGWANNDESAYNLLLGADEVRSRSDKWFSTTVENPWVIFSLADYYLIEKIEFRDGRWYEKEEGVTNVSSYKVYVSTTGTDDGDWQEIISETGVADQEIKTKTLDTPVEARYVKFEAVGGGTDPKKIWIYGFDIYGTYSRPVDRGDLISVGKTVIAAHDHYSYRETPANLLDGLSGNIWAAFGGNPAWAIIDLEQEYDVTRFRLLDHEDWISGYNVYVSRHNVGVSSDEWIPVVTGKTFDKTMHEKEVRLDAPVKARYIKLEIPSDKQSGWMRIEDFEVYGSSIATSVMESVSNNRCELVVSPNPTGNGEFKINASGMLRIYSSQGVLVVQQPVKANEQIVVQALLPGTYLLVLLDTEGNNRQGKLIVK